MRYWPFIIKRQDFDVERFGFTFNEKHVYYCSIIGLYKCKNIHHNSFWNFCTDTLKFLKKEILNKESRRKIEIISSIGQLIFLYDGGWTTCCAFISPDGKKSDFVFLLFTNILSSLGYILNYIFSHTLNYAVFKWHWNERKTLTCAWMINFA